MSHCRRDKGFTLIELLVSMAILFIGMTAILDFLVTYQRINIENAMRNEAMRIAEAKTEYLRNVGFAVLVPGLAAPAAEQRKIRNIDVTYTIGWTVENVTNSNANSRAVEVNVQWVYRGKTHGCKMPSVISSEV